MRRQRRPQQQAEPSIYHAVDDLVTRGHRQGASLANDYAEVLDLLQRVRASHTPADDSPADATAQDDEQRRLWANLVTVHAWLIRDLLHACRRRAVAPAGAHAQDQRYNKLTSLAVAAASVLDALREELDRHSVIGGRIGCAMVRSDSLKCYSRLLVTWPSGINVERVLILVAKVCCLCGLAAVREVGRSGLYAEWARSLADSQLLEHAARVLVRVEEEEATENPRAGMILPASNDMMCMMLGSLELPLQFVGVRHLLSGRPGALTASDAALVAALPAVRSVLSGPCLQYWLGRRLLVAELRAAGTARCHGLPDPSRLVAAPWAMGAEPGCEPSLGAKLWAASRAWHVIASIPLDLPEALGAAVAEAASNDGADSGAVMAAALAAAAAWRRQPLPWRVAEGGMPYSAAHVYDLTHGALAAALRGGTVPASVQLLRPTVLLVRLALERLRPAAAAARLPGLWRVAVSLLRSCNAAEVLLPERDVYPNLHTLVSHLGRLLRLELRRDLWEGTPPSGQAREQAEGGAQAEAAGTAAAAPAPGCSFSLRCALEAGFLPAVEQLLRRLAALQDPRAAELFLYAVDCLLRSSGVWPAVLAHGSVREVTSFILTIRKATEITSNDYLDSIRMADDEDQDSPPLRPQAESYPPGQGLSKVYVAALLEQVLTVLPPLQVLHAVGEPEAGSTCSGGADSGGDDSGTAGSSGAGSGAADDGNAASNGASSGGATTPGRGTGSTGAGSGAGADCGAAGSGGLSGGGPGVGADSRLPLNKALGAGHFAGHGWLARAGGRPTHGSPAAAQQLMLASFTLACWLSVTDAWWSPMVRRIRSAGLAFVARQCLGARLYLSQAAAAPGSVADGVEHQEWLDVLLANFYNIEWLVSQLLGALSRPPGPGAAEARHTLLQHLVFVVAAMPVERALQIARQIIGCCAVEAADGTAPCSQSPHGTELADGAVRAWAAAAAAAAAADPPVGAAADAAAAAEQPAGGGDSTADACTGASTNATEPPPPAGDTVSRAHWLRRRLLQAGCGGLVGVLDAAAPLLLQLEAGMTREAATEAEAGRELAEAEGDANGASCITGGIATGRPSSDGTVDNGVRGGAASAARSALSAQLDDLALELLGGNEWSETTELLPCPATALRAAKEAGVVPCANPGCANLEGPSEAALSCRKTCSRCRAVSYCSGACQLAHWQAGHREGCPAGSAAPSGSGG